ncbi:putative sulfate exporter family transporter, partial [bacterium]|nr:putative sulfate exporter family transporter [bacterium]
FVIGFSLFSLIPTFNLLQQYWIQWISTLSHAFLLVAMSGIGLHIGFSTIIKNGKQALLLASFVFVGQIIFSSLIISVVLK